MANKYEAVIIWETGEKEIYQTRTEAKAEKICRDFKQIFGGQVQWAVTREKR